MKEDDIMHYRVRTALRAILEENAIEHVKNTLNNSAYSISTTTNNKTVLDYILSDISTDIITTNKSRKLYSSEKEAARIIFNSVIPNIDINTIRVIRVTYIETQMYDVQDYFTDSFYEELDLKQYIE